MKKRYMIEIEVDESAGKLNDCPGCLELVLNSTPNTEEKPVRVVGVRPLASYSDKNPDDYRYCHREAFEMSGMSDKKPQCESETVPGQRCMKRQGHEGAHMSMDRD